MDNHFTTLGSLLRQQYNDFCLEISSVLEIWLSEPNWYKGKCKSALVMPLFLHGLLDLYISFQINKDL
jgi:hypothetical protein